MKQKLTFLLAIIILWQVNTKAQTYSGGAGTPADPYQIANLADLQTLSTTDADWDNHFKQTTNINASATSGWNSGDGFIPIGNSTTRFKSTGSSITHLGMVSGSVIRKECVGGLVKLIVIQSQKNLKL